MFTQSLLDFLMDSGSDGLSISYPPLSINKKIKREKREAKDPLNLNLKQSSMFTATTLQSPLTASVSSCCAFRQGYRQLMGRSETQTWRPLNMDSFRHLNLQRRERPREDKMIFRYKGTEKELGSPVRRILPISLNIFDVDHCSSVSPEIFL